MDEDGLPVMLWLDLPLQSAPSRSGPAVPWAEPSATGAGNGSGVDLLSRTSAAPGVLFRVFIRFTGNTGRCRRWQEPTRPGLHPQAVAGPSKVQPKMRPPGRLSGIPAQGLLRVQRNLFRPPLWGRLGRRAGPRGRLRSVGYQAPGFAGVRAGVDPDSFPPGNTGPGLRPLRPPFLHDPMPPDPAHHPGKRYVLAHRRSPTLAWRQLPAGRSLGSSGRSVCGTLSVSSTIRATVWCPSGERCSRSGSHIRGSRSCLRAHRSAITAPCREAIVWAFSLKIATFAPVTAQHGRRSPVRSRKQHHRCTRLAQQPDAGIKFAGQLVRVAAAEHHVIASRRHRDQVRLQSQGRADLPVQDLLQQQAADGKVRVGKVLAANRQLFSHTVGPATQPARAPRFRIPDPFRERVPQGHIPVPRVQAAPRPMGRRRG